jgi:hypothetical protein
VTGVKIWIVGVLATILLLLPLIALGFASVSMIALGAEAGGAGAVAKSLSGGLFLVFIIASLIVEGYLAQKLWRWT